MEGRDIKTKEKYPWNEADLLGGWDRELRYLRRKRDISLLKGH
jgi:hypothetical protein